MIRIFTSHSNRARLAAAGEFVAGFAPGSEILLLGATRESLDDFVRCLSAGGVATFGLYRFSLTQLVTLLATGGLASRGLAPASPLAMEAVAARAAFEARAQGRLGRLDPVIGFPGFPRALARTLSELRCARLGAAPSDGGEKALEDLAPLLEIFERDLDQAAAADRSRLLEIAADELASGAPSPFVAVPLLLLDLPVSSALETDFLRALVGTERNVLATVPSGDRETLESLAGIGDLEPFEGKEGPSPESSLTRLQKFLFAEGTPPEGTADDRCAFFSAPGEARECVEIARRILETSRQGIPFDEVAVFLRTPAVYSGHLETAFRRAGIPAYFARGTRRPDPAGRAFLALLACRSEGLSAKRFAEYLSFGQVPELDDDGAPPSDRETWAGPEDESLGPAVPAVQLSFPFDRAPRAAEGDEEEDEDDAPDREDSPTLAGTLRAPWKWEEFLVEAAVIGGKERWERRLRGHERELGLKLDELSREDPESARIAAIRRDLAKLRHLERFALPVIASLDALPIEAAWGEWNGALCLLAPRVLRKPERVLAVLGEMQPMAAVGPVAIEEVRAVLTERLSLLEQERPDHRYGRVFVATPDLARGRSFRAVFIPGLAERGFPQRPREDPLLLDARRIALRGALATQAERGRRERLLLRLAVGAAEERVTFSYPRVDVVEGRPRVPSFYGLDVARATRGMIPDYEQLEREAAAASQARLAWPAPPEPADAIDAVEHDLSVLGPLLKSSRSGATKGRAYYLLGQNPFLARSLRAQWVRWHEKRWRPHDGLVRVTPHTSAALEAQRPKARPYSVTALQRFATCPYQFLLAAIHRLEPREEAAALIRMDPLTRGRLIHHIQAETLQNLKDGGALPVTADRLSDAEALLGRVVDRVAAAYREDLAPAIPRVWEDEVGGIRADLRVWLQRMAAEPGGWVPSRFEFKFGIPFDPPCDPASLEEPITLEDGWKLRGAVDLIEEQTGTGRLRVTDHKSGSNRTPEGAVVGGGEILQPVLYSLAVESAMKKEVTEGRLSFCTAKGGFTSHPVAMDKWARLYGKKIIEAVDRAVAGGSLPPAPREDGCRFCDFRAVCGPNAEDRARRKDRTVLQELHQIRQLP